MEGAEKENLLHVCYSFGGKPYSNWEQTGADFKGNYCYMGVSDLKTVTDANTCEELKGDFNTERTRCRIPIENVMQLRKRKHPKYYDDPLDQLSYELLVEEAQSSVLTKEEERKKDPNAEQRWIDALKKNPLFSLNVVTGINDKKIETKKIKDVYLNDRIAKIFLDSIDLMFVENHAKDRYAQIVYHAFYYDLPQNIKNKIRYRLNKHIKDFKI